jgi:hypothetical protein
MRRLTLYALAGALIISACSDQNTESPTEPSVAPPSNTFTCAHGTYTLASVAALANDASLWKNKPAQTEALLRLGTIALLWNTCNDALARKAALAMLVWMDKNTAKNANPTKVQALKDAILAGFGGASATGGDDFASGVYFPGEEEPLIVTTPSGKATIKLMDGAFNEPTLITVRRLPDNSLTNVPEGFTQDAPTWDYDATNSSTNNTVQTHTLATPGTAIIAFCFKEGDGEVTYPEPGAQIGHNPVGGGFEFVDEVPVPEDLLAELSACDFSGGGLSSGSGLGRYLGSLAQKLFLPEQLHAAMVGTRGPIAGTPISLSPFGIVVPSPSTTLGFTTGGDPSGQSGTEAVVWDCGDDICNHPGVFLSSGESGVAISVELIPVGTSTGQFDVGSTTSVQTVDGVAVFNNLPVTGPYPGTYQLRFSGGGASVTSGTFTVFENIIG